MSTSRKIAPAKERFIVLLRHGIAEDRTPEKNDADRALTAEGHARMKQIARGLEAAFPRAQAIYSSPLLRAMQTALWVSKGYRSRVNINSVDALTPDATTDDFIKLIASIKESRSIIVGHEPNLTDNLRALLALGDSQSIELKKGGCYGVLLHNDGSAALEWLLPPRILRKMGGG